jgi:dinuclear metal center YbgI/SA1388 family protein
MLIRDVDRYFRSFLKIDELARIDVSLNGLQVGRESPEVKRIAFAVDACRETFRLAADWGADLLVVHHGLFWGRELPITGTHRKRLRYLFEKDLGLYAVHLPLDIEPSIGNNAGLAKTLGLLEPRPFGKHKGIDVGIQGRFSQAQTLVEIGRLLFGEEADSFGSLPFGKEKIETVGIVSGGAPYEALQAIEEELDLYITGEGAHAIYHQCLEAGLNVIFGGHYRTETWGVRLLAEKTMAETSVETRFFDLPTGL